MRRLIALVIFLAAFPAWALVSIVDDAPQHGGGASYTGPGDIVGSWRYWVGLRAFSSATRGTRFANLCNGGVCADVSSDATTGLPPNAPTINGSACDNSGHQCTVAVLYDQSGGSTDFVQATGANQPQWTVSCSGLSASLPCLYGHASSHGLTATASQTDSQPYTLIGAAIMDVGGGGRIICPYNGSSGSCLYFAPDVSMYAGSGVTIATNTNIWYSAQAMFNGSSAKSYVNGTLTTGLNAGAAATNTATGVMIDGQPASALQGHFVEAGLIPSDASANFVAMDSNIRAAWGF